MSSLRALGIAQAPRKPRPHSVIPPNRFQEDQPASPPASEALKGWTCNNPYKCCNQGHTEDGFEKIEEVVQKHDKTSYKNIKEEIDFLMVVAGLLLAIVTTFMIESYKLLQEDKQNTISDLLVEVVLLLNDTSTQGHARLPKSFTPVYRDIVVNQLWFLSIILSLLAVLIGTFCLQWISAYRGGLKSIHKSASPAVELGMRHLRYNGFIHWGVAYAPEVLLLIVQLSITLFTSGLIYFLWNVNTTAAIPAIVVTGITGTLLFLTFQCPYKSPTSWLIRVVSDFFVLILKPLLMRWGGDTVVRHRFTSWLKSRPAPWGDYVWKVHDEFCVAMQESWNVCSSTRSFGLGLSSAFGILAREPDALDTIHDSIHNLRLIPEKSKFLEEGFKQSLSETEARILNGGVCEWSGPSSWDQQHHIDQMRHDFFCALIFQNLVDRSAKLCRILFQHRVELYIRIKNSTLSVWGDLLSPDQFHGFSDSLTSPFFCKFNTGNLSLELKFQFLNYLIRFWERGRPTKFRDIIVAAEIISRAPSEYPDPEWRLPGFGHPPSRIREGEMHEEKGTPQMASSVSAAREVTIPDSGGYNTLAETGYMHGSNAPESVGLIIEETRYGPHGVCEGTNAEYGTIFPGNSIHRITDFGGYNTFADTGKTHGLNATGHAGLTIDEIRQGPAGVCEGTNAGDGATFSGNDGLRVTVDDRPNSGDLGTVGKKGNEGGYCNSPNKKRRSDQQNIDSKTAENSQLKASFMSACSQVKQKLLAYAKSTPQDGYKDEVLRILGSGRGTDEKDTDV